MNPEKMKREGADMGEVEPSAKTADKRPRLVVADKKETDAADDAMQEAASSARVQAREEADDLPSFSLEQKLKDLFTTGKIPISKPAPPTRRSALRASIGGLLALIGVGGVTTAAEQLESMSAKETAREQVRLDALNMPRIENTTRAKILDMTFTEISDRFEITNFLARTTGYSTPDGAEYIDTEKTYCIYGSQLARYLSLRGLEKSIAEETEKDPNLVRLERDVVSETLVRLPGSGQGLVEMEFVGSDTLQGHYTDEQIRDGYDDVYANQLSMISAAVDSSGYLSGDDSSRGPAKQAITKIASEMVDMGSLSFDIGRLASAPDPFSNIETTLFEGDNARLRQWENELEELNAAVQNFSDLAEAESGNKTTEFEKMMTAFAEAQDGHVRGLLAKAGYEQNLTNGS